MSKATQTTGAALRLAAVVVLLAIAVGVVLASCREDASKTVAAKPSADKVYTTRGKIEMLPVAGKSTTQFVIKHEAIDDFVNADGSRGMNSMSMPMVVASGVSLSDLAVGDCIEFDLSVWYVAETTRINAYQVTRVRKLPADTELKFGRAAPTLGDGK